MRAAERLRLMMPAKPAPKATSHDRQSAAPGPGLLALQRQAGNRAVNLVLQRQAATGPLALDPDQLRLEGKTPGAGATSLQRQAAPAPMKQVSTLVIFHEPTIIRKPSAEIVAGHGRQGIAGWTTPYYDLTFPKVAENEIQAQTVIDFKMELDSSYRGGFLSVLQDHEQGHVRIGQEKAKATFGDQLGSVLQGLPDFRRAKPILDARDAAARAFESQEGDASRVYDDTDYPRMVNAYYGAKTPLAKLIARSAGIRRLTNAMWSLIVLSGKKKLTSATVAARAEAVAKVRDVLPDDDLERLQYNLGFKGYAARCGSVVSELQQRSDLDEGAKGHLFEAASVLGDFKWKVDDVLITIGAI
jgi:hypothetical protein